MEGEKKVIGIDTMTTILEPEISTGGGLCMPQKERVMYRPPERKSTLGLDVLAHAKRGDKHDTGFKIPAQRKTMAFNNLVEDEKSGSLGIEESKDDSPCGTRGHASRRYQGYSVEDNSFAVLGTQQGVAVSLL